MAPRQLALPTIEIDRPLTVHSTGLGVESNAFTVLVNEDPRFEQYQPDAYVHVDTGGELPHTHQTMLTSINEYLARYGQEVIVIAPDDERYQTPSKAYPMDEAYLRQPKPGIPTRNRRSCTINHKIVPVRKFLNAEVDTRWGKWKQLGRHTVLVTIAADEADRCGGRTSYVDPDAKYVEVRYPLVEFGVTRADCYDILHDRGLPALKSGCFWCPFQPLAWFWAIRELGRRGHPWYEGLHERSVRMEREALKHNPKLTLTGSRPLEEEIDAWVERQAALPDPEDVLKEEYTRGDRNWSCAA